MALKVLIVEDTRAARELLVATVEGLPGVEAVGTGSGFEALKLLPQHDFDAIITDLHMPELNGLELLHFVRQHPRHKGTPLILVSAEGSAGEKARALGADGPTEFLEKPFAPEALEALLRRHLSLP